MGAGGPGRGATPPTSARTSAGPGAKSGGHPPGPRGERRGERRPSPRSGPRTRGIGEVVGTSRVAADRRSGQ
eukprot:8283839-Pyramimonas_sp.AAC.1